MQILQRGPGTFSLSYTVWTPSFRLKGGCLSNKEHFVCRHPAFFFFFNWNLNVVSPTREWAWLIIATIFICPEVSLKEMRPGWTEIQLRIGRNANKTLLTGPSFSQRLMQRAGRFQESVPVSLGSGQPQNQLPWLEVNRIFLFVPRNVTEEGLQGRGHLLPKDNNNSNNKDDSRNKILPSSSRAIRKCPVICVGPYHSP